MLMIRSIVLELSCPSNRRTYHEVIPQSVEDSVQHFRTDVVVSGFDEDALDEIRPPLARGHAVMAAVVGHFALLLRPRRVECAVQGGRVRLDAVHQRRVRILLSNGRTCLHQCIGNIQRQGCLLYTSPSPRDRQKSRMPSSA